MDRFFANTAKMFERQELPSLDELYKFKYSAAYKDADLRKMLQGSPIEQAFFLNQHAMEYSWQYMIKLQTHFEDGDYKLEGGLKTNLVRITQKITEMNSPYGVTDMIRARITVREPHELKEVFLKLQNLNAITITKVANHLNHKQSELQTIVLNCIFMNDHFFECIIGEIELCLAEKPPNYRSN